MKTRRSSVHVLACSALFSMGLITPVSPLHAVVESDVVGYTTIEMNGDGWYLLGSPFESLDGSETFRLNDVFNGSGFSTGDILYLMDENGTFTPLYWLNTGSEQGWNKLNSSRPAFDSNEYPAGMAVYLYKKAPGTVTFSGKVSAMTVEFGAEGASNTWHFVNLSYPESRSIMEYSWQGCHAGDVLYYVSPKGEITPLYWNERESAWSLFNGPRYVEDTTKLAVGQAVYVYRASPGVGTVSAK